MSSIIDKNPNLAAKFEKYGFGILFSLLVVIPMIVEDPGKDYDLINIYITWCLDKFLSIFNHLAG